jgi:hypothetical protein
MLMRLVIKFIALAILSSLPAAALAATVRGKLIRGRAPAAGIAVTVMSAQKVRTAAAYSGADGMYYIPNVRAGNYTLEVWANRNRPLTFPLQVREPRTDVNPVNVP